MGALAEDKGQQVMKAAPSSLMKIPFFAFCLNNFKEFEKKKSLSVSFTLYNLNLKKKITLGFEWMENIMLYSWEILVSRNMTTHLDNCMFHMGAKSLVLHLFMSPGCNYFLVILLCAALYKYKIEK